MVKLKLWIWRSFSALLKDKPKTLGVFLIVFCLIVFVFSWPKLRQPAEFKAGMVLKADMGAENDLKILDEKATQASVEKGMQEVGLYFHYQENQNQVASKNLKEVVKKLQKVTQDFGRFQSDFEKTYLEDYALSIYSLATLKSMEVENEIATKYLLLAKKSASALKSQNALKMEKIIARSTRIYGKNSLALAYLKKMGEENRLTTNQKRNAELASVSGSLHLNLSAFELQSFFSVFGNKNFSSRIDSLVHYIYQRPFVQDKNFFFGQQKYKVNILNKDGSSFPIGNLANTPDVKELLEASITKSLSFSGGGGEEENKFLVKFLSKFFQPNLVYDETYTQALWDKNVVVQKPFHLEIKRGSILATQGEQLTEDKAYLLNLYQQANNNINFWPRFSSQALSIFLWLASIFLILRMPFVATESFRLWQSLRMALTFLLVQFVISYLILKFSNPFFQFLSPVLTKREASIFLVGISALLTALLLNNYSGYLFFLLGVPLLSIYIQPQKKISTRSQIIGYGFKIAMAHIGIALLTSLVNYPSYQEFIPLTVLGSFIGFSLLGSLMSIMLVIVTLPIFEQIFDIKTDIKLLELSNVNHPILLDLLNRAPGSYQHSIAVGTLAEAGAMKIGANPLFCRVASYYHDIGKIENSGYFVENMVDLDHNPHVALADPIRSAHIIINHVKNGIQLAEKHHLGREIISIIREHHGTSLVRFFYHEYLKKHPEPNPLWKESDFRYSGPKPQSIESALIMIADVCEASCRSLRSPSPDQIVEIVKAVSNYILEDGQLDESHISLKDFKDIQITYIHLLQSQFHARFAYPEKMLSRARSF